MPILRKINATMLINNAGMKKKAYFCRNFITDTVFLHQSTKVDYAQLNLKLFRWISIIESGLRSRIIFCSRLEE